MCVCIYTSTYFVCVYIYTRTHKHTPTEDCARAHTCAHTHARTHMRAHTCVHTYKLYVHIKKKNTEASVGDPCTLTFDLPNYKPPQKTNFKKTKNTHLEATWGFRV